MAKQALGPDTIPEGVSVDLDEVCLLAIFSWRGGKLELDLLTIAEVAKRADDQVRKAIATDDSASGRAGSIRVKLTSEGCPDTCELSLAAWATALRHLEKRVVETVGKCLGEYLQERII